jgi:cation transport protein ChaC
MTRWPHDPTTLCRADLEQGRMRELYATGVSPDRALTDEQLSASLAATLTQKPAGAGWWIFAYGSLLWNPLFPVAEMRAARLHGYHRRFCLWSLASRGTLARPGLVLGLEQGGACRGVALRLPAPLALDELHLLWRREMVVNSYRPRWVHLEAEGKRVTALTFIVRRDHPQYAGKLGLDEESSVCATAAGAFGSTADYLERTRIALVAHGIVDPYLETLAAAVVQRRGTGFAGPDPRIGDGDGA